MRSLKNIFFIFLLGLAGGAFAQLPRLRVSDDKHFLVTADGKPFFWLGDTGWELFHRLDKTDAAMYLKTPSEQVFTVIQAKKVPSRYRPARKKVCRLR